MKTALRTIALLFLTATLCAGQSDRKVALVNSPDAPGIITVDRLKQCFVELARQWDIPEKDLPNIVVFHVSKKTAETAFVTQETAVRRNMGGSDAYYEVWLVGKPDLKYVLAFQNVIEYHFTMHPSDQKRNEVVDRVARMEYATVSVQEGK